MRFVLVGLALLASWSLAVPAAYAVPNFGEGWVDQGGKWHSLSPNGGNSEHGEGAGSPDSHAGGTPHNDGGENGTSGSPGDQHESGENNDTGGSGSNDPSAQHTVFSDLPLNNDIVPGDFEVDPRGGSPGGQGPNDGGPHNDSGGSSVVTDGPSHAAIPEPSSMALLAGALVAAGAARRRKCVK